MKNDETTGSSEATSSDELKARNQLTGPQFFSMTISMVLTAYGFAAFALNGAVAIFFLFIAGILWFVPVTRTAGEMASIDGWERGGVFTWTKATLGDLPGWASIFYQWIHITVGINTMMYFAIGCLSISVGFPFMNDNPVMRFFFQMLILWSLIVIQQRGTKTTGKIAQWCFLLGVALPTIFLLLVFIIYLAKGNKMLITINWHTIFPKNYQFATLVGLVPFVLAFAGADGSATHVKDLKNPRVYPKAMMLLAIIAIATDIIGSLSIAGTIPVDKIQLSTGVVYAYGYIVAKLGFSAAMVQVTQTILGVLFAIGILGIISGWVVGPNAGMHEAALQGYMPKIFTKTNRWGIETNLMILQGIVVSLMGAYLTFGAGGTSSNVSFRTAMGLTVAIYMVMYMTMFVGYLVLQFKHNDIHRVFLAGRTHIMRILIGISGFLLSLLSFIVTFFAPTGYTVAQGHTYTKMLLVAFTIVLVIPFIMYAFRKKWAKEVGFSIEDAKEDRKRLLAPGKPSDDDAKVATEED